MTQETIFVLFTVRTVLYAAICKETGLKCMRVEVGGPGFADRFLRLTGVDRIFLRAEAACGARKLCLSLADL